MNPFLFYREVVDFIKQKLTIGKRKLNTERMLETIRKNGSLYLIEAWALGTFMVVASLVVIVVEHPDLPVRSAISSLLLRRAIIGVCMGLTAVGLIYSPWGKLSGAHLNPAVTLAQWRLNRITTTNMVFYIIAQFIGGSLGVGLVHTLLPDYIAHSSVNYVATVPGETGVWVALGFEFGMAFLPADDGTGPEQLEMAVNVHRLFRGGSRGLIYHV